MVHMNILLFDAEETYVRIIRNISHRDPGHQPGKKSKDKQKPRIEDVGAADNLFYF